MLFNSLKKKGNLGTSLVVQWLRICLPMQRVSNPGQGTKIPHATTRESACHNY